MISYMIHHHILGHRSKSWLHTKFGWVAQRQATVFGGYTEAKIALEELNTTKISEPAHVQIVSFKMKEIDRAIYTLRTTRYTPGMAE